MSRCPPTCRKATSSTSAMPAPTPRPTRASSTASRCRKSGYSSRSRGGNALVAHEVETRAVGRGVRFALRFPPRRAVEARKPRVALVVAENLREIEAMGHFERFGKQALPADHVGDWLTCAYPKRCAEGRSDDGAGG